MTGPEDHLLAERIRRGSEDAFVRLIRRYDVHIGERCFTCMRVFDLERDASDRDVMVEAYITRAGRTVLFRRYNGSRWGKKDVPPHNWGEEMTWEEDLPHNHRMVIGGVTYVHHYDSLADSALVSK